MFDAVNVLQIEDSPTIVELTRSMLAEANGAQIAVESVGTLADGIKRLSRGGIDVVLLDLTLPDSEGLNTFRVLNAAAAKVPVVIYTSVDDEKQSLIALHEGAADYLVKSEVTPKWLARSLKYALTRDGKLDLGSSANNAKAAAVERLLEIKQSTETPSTFVATFIVKRVVNVAALDAAKNQLLNLARRSDCERIELDCSIVEYVANAAISTLLIVHKKSKAAEKPLVLTNVSRQVFEQFSSRRFDKVFQIERVGEAG